jgi:hypothetical protein
MEIGYRLRPLSRMQSTEYENQDDNIHAVFFQTGGQRVGRQIPHCSLDISDRRRLVKRVRLPGGNLAVQIARIFGEKSTDLYHLYSVRRVVISP